MSNMSGSGAAHFIRGMGAGLMVGGAIGMAFAPKKKTKTVVGRALKAAGELADNISDAMMR